MLRFTLRQLEAFYWTAKLGTAHAAADHLSLTQPAVSTRIRDCLLYTSDAADE
mgnify:CR=1 FL=1